MLFRTLSKRRLLLAAACVLAGFTVAAAPPATAASTSVSGGYVALGDSYSAGVGAAPYTDPDCKRSDSAYAPLLAQELESRSFTFVACSGHTTADVVAGQLSALNRGTKLVTITIGGNDIGFGNGIGICLQGTEADCAAVVAAGEQIATTTLPTALDSLYKQIRAKAPHAKLVVLGYPHLFELTADCATAPLSLTKRTALNGAADVLDTVIAQQARKAGATFVDVRQAFAGHGVCGADPWVHGLVADGAFHPTTAGYAAGYLAALRPYVDPRCNWV